MLMFFYLTNWQHILTTDEFLLLYHYFITHYYELPSLGISHNDTVYNMGIRVQFIIYCVIHSVFQYHKIFLSHNYQNLLLRLHARFNSEFGHFDEKKSVYLSHISYYSWLVIQSSIKKKKNIIKWDQRRHVDMWCCCSPSHLTPLMLLGLYCDQAYHLLSCQPIPPHSTIL